MDEKERARALEQTLGQIEKQFGKGSILRLGSKDAIVPVSVISTGSIALDAALGTGGFPRGRICEIYGPESSGKTTIALQVIAEVAEDGRHGGVHRRGARARSDLRAQARRRRRQSAGVAARLRRAGAGNHRRADRLGIDRRAGGGFGGGAGSQSRTRRRNGRFAHGPAGAADVAGAAQTHRHGFEIENLPDLHQPDSRKDRRDVRQPGNHHRRPRAEVLFVGARRYPAHRGDQGWRRRGRQPDQGQGGEEQAGVAVPRSRIRHRLWRGHLEEKAK